MINITKLDRDIRTAGYDIEGVSPVTGTERASSWNAFMYGSEVVQVHFKTPPDQAAMTAVANLVAAHDPTDTDAVALSDVHEHWQSSPLHNKTPQQIFTAMQNQIDGWTSLAQAKADLRVWLPQIVASLAWSVFKEQHRD
jgi:hypothetical protein